MGGGWVGGGGVGGGWVGGGGVGGGCVGGGSLGVGKQVSGQSGPQFCGHSGTVGVSQGGVQYHSSGSTHVCADSKNKQLGGQLIDTARP